MLDRRHKQLLYLLFSASGFCALIYEVLWTKHLSLSCGTTMPAISIVTATFMGGLALGSYFIGRFVDREQNLLKIYALLEAAIAFFALTFPPALNIVHSGQIWAERFFPQYSGIEHFFHFAAAGLLLLPPTFAMGGTFPLMCRLFARHKSGGQIGRLYALNTLGATAGALCAGYILIPNLGLTRTSLFAITINLVIAIVSAHLARSGPMPAKDQKPNSAPPLQIRPHLPILLASGMVGAISLGYELLWTRLFLLFLGNTTFAFALILGAFLIGIALGGAYYARKVHPKLNEYQVFGRLLLLMALAVLATIPWYDQLANVFLKAHALAGESWLLLTLISLLIVFVVMALPTIISGSLLPAATAVLQTGQSQTGAGVGLVVLANTVGSMLGSLITGFVLIPMFGTEVSFRLLAGLTLATGLAFILRTRHQLTFTPQMKGMVCCGALLVLAPWSWNAKLMNSGVYCYAESYLRFGGIEYLLGPEQILTVIEGSETTVAVKEVTTDGTVRYFSVNGKTDGGNGKDMATQALVGGLPLLVHADPHTALVIGLGTGITLGSVTGFPLDQIDCVEISPEVVKASGYFVRENRQALSDPRVRLFVEDGRDLMQISEKRYDTIISQPSNPWQAGNANLFTSDFYQLAARRLNRNGIFCQWIGLYDITTENLRIACNTLLQVFPHAMAFRVGGDMILLASFAPLQFDYQTMLARMSQQQLRPLLEVGKLSAPSDVIARHFILNDTNLRRFAAHPSINSDDRPILEFSFRHHIGGKMFSELMEQNIAALAPYQTDNLVPLVNLGTTPQQTLRALQQLAGSYRRLGKGAETRYFMEKAREIEMAEEPPPTQPLIANKS